MGRSPDYMNAVTMVTSAAAVHWGTHEARWGENARGIYQMLRRQDLCLSHTWAQPHNDRFKKPREQPTTLRIARETSAGPVLSGARAVGTIAPMANGNHV